MNNNYQMGQIIAEARKKLGMTQSDLANQLGLSPQAVSKWENGMGCPDISFLPEIGKVLHLSMDQLFGLENADVSAAQEEGEKVDLAPREFPESYHGLPLVAHYQDRACYSDASFLRQEEEMVYFENGSQADLKENISISHKGSQIFIVFARELYEEEKRGKNQEKRGESPGKIRRLDITIHGASSVEIQKSQNNQFSWKVEGSPEFIKQVQITQQEDCLYVSSEKIKEKNKRFFQFFHEENRRILLYCPEDRLEKLTLSSSGASNVDSQINFLQADLQISGAGDIDLKEAGDLTLRSSGAGELKLASCASARLQLSGASDVKINRIQGKLLDVSMSGAGNLTVAQGEVTEFACQLSGAGDVNCKGLTVGNSQVRLHGFGAVILGRVKGQSLEQVSMGGSLKILQRG